MRGNSDNEDPGQGRKKTILGRGVSKAVGARLDRGDRGGQRPIGPATLKKTRGESIKGTKKKHEKTVSGSKTGSSKPRESHLQRQAARRRLSKEKAGHTALLIS